MYNRRELTKGLFESWCNNCGLNCNEDGLPACVHLRRCFSLQETVSYDWVHTLLQDGFVSDAVFRLFDSWESKIPDFTMRALERFLQMDWLFRPCFGSNPNNSIVYSVSTGTTLDRSIPSLMPRPRKCSACTVYCGIMLTRI